MTHTVDLWKLARQFVSRCGEDLINYGVRGTKESHMKCTAVLIR